MRPAATAKPRIDVTMSKILIIDDDPAARRMISRVLMDGQHQVIEAQNGVEGVRLYRAEAPDLIITDIIMPEQEGIQTIAEIRSTNSTVGIIAISGGGSGDGDLYLSMAEELGADAVLAKPFRPSELVALVDGLLSRDLVAAAAKSK
jgi:DNA-binding response OmpR family regulator